MLTIQGIEERMARGETFLFLDIRSKKDFQNWLIKGQTLQAINVPYYDFLQNEINDTVMPPDCCVVCIDLTTATARKIADVLRGKDFEVTSLEGGYEAWAEFYVQAEILSGPAVKLVQFHRLSTGCISYMMVTANEAIVVDPSRHIGNYLRAAEREHAKITHIIDTHMHADHISGARALLHETAANYLVAHSELHRHDLPVSQLSEGSLRLGSITMKVIILDTEGETQGNSLLECNHQFVFSGNAIAVGEVAVPDLPGDAQEWAEKLINTVLREISYLSDDSLLLPAHYAAISEVNQGGYIGAMLGEVRRGVKAITSENVLTFTQRPRGFVSVLPIGSDAIKRINAGLGTLDGVSAAELESSIRQ